jgi:hypothetical protein
VCIEWTCADKLSQSLNVLVLPLPSRHDDNCSIGTIGGGRMPDAIAPHACSFTSSADYELALILKEIRYITDQVSEPILLLLVLFITFRAKFCHSDTKRGRRVRSGERLEICCYGR